MPFDIKLPKEVDKDYLKKLKKRRLTIDKTIDIDTLTNEINNGLS
jgi:hypothetical protein